MSPVRVTEIPPSTGPHSGPARSGQAVPPETTPRQVRAQKSRMWTRQRRSQPRPRRRSEWAGVPARESSVVPVEMTPGQRRSATESSVPPPTSSAVLGTSTKNPGSPSSVGSALPASPWPVSVCSPPLVVAQTWSWPESWVWAGRAVLAPNLRATANRATSGGPPGRSGTCPPRPRGSARRRCPRPPQSLPPARVHTSSEHIPRAKGAASGRTVLDSTK